MYFRGCSLSFWPVRMHRCGSTVQSRLRWGFSQLEREDSSLKGYNCMVEKKGDTLEIKTTAALASRIHLNLKRN